MNTQLHNNNEDIFFSFQQGEEQAFVYLFDNYYKPLVHFAYTFLKETEAAEDVIEDCFAKLWERREIITSETATKAYLYKSVRNACIDSLRKKAHKAVYEAYVKKSPEEFSKDTLQNIVIKEAMHHVFLALQNLPSKYKRIFDLLWVQGKEVKEVAAELNLPVSTIKSQKARALELIRKQLPQLGSFVLLLIMGMFH